MFISQQRKWKLIGKSRGVLRGMTSIAAITAAIFLALRIANTDLQQEFQRGDFDFEIFAAPGRKKRAPLRWRDGVLLHGEVRHLYINPRLDPARHWQAVKIAARRR